MDHVTPCAMGSRRAKRHFHVLVTRLWPCNANGPEASARGRELRMIFADDAESRAFEAELRRQVRSKAGASERGQKSGEEGALRALGFRQAAETGRLYTRHQPSLIRFPLDRENGRLYNRRVLHEIPCLPAVGPITERECGCPARWARRAPPADGSLIERERGGATQIPVIA